MKISELTALTALEKAAQIPVALLGENRSISLGQILEALQKSVVRFGSDMPDSVTKTYAEGSTESDADKIVPVWDEDTQKFYGTLVISGAATLYSEWTSKADYYDEAGAVRRDCLFIQPDGRLWYFNGTTLISAGLTDAQAALLQKLTPKPIGSESELEALQKAGEIIPGQIYYIPEDE